MNASDQSIKIKIDTSSFTAEDLEDIRRWENEGGHPSTKPDIFFSFDLPLHKKEIFEVLNSELISEDGQVYLLVDKL